MPKPIDNRNAMIDHIADVMHSRWPSWSIDTLLTWPDQAQAMAREVCKRLQRKPAADAIHEVCRAALAARKAGGLKRDVA